MVHRVAQGAVTVDGPFDKRDVIQRRPSLGSFSARSRPSALKTSIGRVHPSSGQSPDKQSLWCSGINVVGSVPLCCKVIPFGSSRSSPGHPRHRTSPGRAGNTGAVRHVPAEEVHTSPRSRKGRRRLPVVPPHPKFPRLAPCLEQPRGRWQTRRAQRKILKRAFSQLPPIDVSGSLPALSTGWESVTNNHRNHSYDGFWAITPPTNMEETQSCYHPPHCERARVRSCLNR